MPFPTTSFSASGTPATTATGSLTHFRQATIQIPVTLASLANSQVRKVAVPYAFRVESVRFRVGAPASTASKLATLTPQISGVAIATLPASAALALTTANCNTAGATVALSSSAVIDSGNSTSTNTGAAGATLEVAVSSVTAFAEGDGWVEFVVSNIECLQ